MAFPSITLIDAGTGNIRSVQKALEWTGARVTVASDPDTIRSGARLVLPGVGAFGNFMKGMRINHLDEAIVEAVQQGYPLLGICVGMQAMFEIGEEMGESCGLGLFPGRVIRFPETTGLKIPHTGWNQLWFDTPSLLTRGIPAGDYTYFNHSFYCQPANTGYTTSFTDYGVKFASVIQREYIYGVQFHPEKSQRVGLQVLANFTSI